VIVDALGRVVGVAGRVVGSASGWLRQQIDLRQPPAGQETVFLGLGGNLGDRLDHLNRAVRMLDANPRIDVDDISSVYETDPVGPAEEQFLNIAVRARTDMAPLALLRACQEVEAALGRVRTVRWGSRTIDVDVLVYGDRSIDTAVLTVPHAHLDQRGFALVPLMEVAPGWRLPDGRTLGQIVAGLVPIEGVVAIGRQVSLQPMPSGPPDVGAAGRSGRPADGRGAPS
jgi:2-amino-4-hydroxy-6-hydroxymethyldihydropteridine diphosphokinase